MRLLTLAISLLAGLSWTSVFAETPTAPPQLPEAGEGSTAGILINASNAKEYKSLIIPELYPLVRANLIELDAVRTLRYTPAVRFGGDGVPAVQSPELTADGSIKPPVILPPGIYFPQLDQKNPQQLVRQILWNVQSHLWSYKYIESQFVLTWLQGYKLVRQFGGKWRRIYPKALSQEDKSIQLFRDSVEFFAPAAVRGFFWLTFRFFGAEEDMFWVNSPVIEKARQLTGTNRSDQLLNTVVAADDIWVWSGKAEAIEPKEVKLINALAFFAGADGALLKIAPAACEEFAEAGAAASNPKAPKWNFESRRFGQAFGWLPTGAVVTPRKMWRIEMVTRDPYSAYGRQVLYVDAELNVPLYKFVYNRAGYLWKIVVGVYNQFTSADKSRRFFMPQYMIVDDLISKNSNMIDNSRVYFCEKFSERANLKEFDPQAKVKRDEPKEAKPAA